MLGRSGARAGSGLPRGWIALCWLSLLPLGLADTHNGTTVTTAATSPAVFANVSNQEQESTTSSTLQSTSPNHTSPTLVSQDSNVTTGTQLLFSESTINFTSTSGITPIPETMNASVQTQTSRTIPVSTTSTNLPTSGKTLGPSTFAGNVSDGPANHTSSMTSYTQSYPSSSSPVIVKGAIKCLEIKEVKLTQGICLEQNETTLCEDFKKDKGVGLIQLLCKQEQEDPRAGGCSLLLTQSDIKPQCLMLVLANRTELSSKLQLMGKHQSDLEKLGIHSFTAESVGSHQHYSRKTLIALVTSGILLAILGTTGYFLMNRRSWSPTGERLELEP
ncbi:hematopoietic progenitor cell antigen CD34 isoform X2 [Tenrec ecaudatus]|uniref:hematopoietic progenitor cell antigen CD34 isoform X2 n=1 Tax=Tenrec ecaudatus TaxID=94439 RepID=UPI003F597181